MPCPLRTWSCSCPHEEATAFKLCPTFQSYLPTPSLVDPSLSALGIEGVAPDEKGLGLVTGCVPLNSRLSCFPSGLAVVPEGPMTGTSISTSTALTRTRAASAVGCPSPAVLGTLR